MSGLLEQMAISSLIRAQTAASREPPAALRARAAELPAPPALVLDGAFQLIAEFKRSSPALGRLSAGDGTIASRVRDYARGGAVAVSVLTEPERFDGSLADLAEAAAVLAPLGVSVLRKDFLVDPYQLLEARAAGAGGVLLIARMLSGPQLAEMLDCARELSLFVLAEAFDAADIERIAGAVRGLPPAREGASILVGVNSRNLQTLEVAPNRFRELAPLLPRQLPHVAESGISRPDQCAEIARCGYSAALVGGSLMREPSPSAAIQAMLAAGRAADRNAA